MFTWWLPEIDALAHLNEQVSQIKDLFPEIGQKRVVTTSLLASTAELVGLSTLFSFQFVNLHINLAVTFWKC